MEERSNLGLHYSLIDIRPLFTLSHRESVNSPLLILFSANHIDQLNCDLYPFDLTGLHARGVTKT